jgi:hypothetical protein
VQSRNDPAEPVAGRARHRLRLTVIIPSGATTDGESAGRRGDAVPAWVAPEWRRAGYPNKSGTIERAGFAGSMRIVMS